MMPDEYLPPNKILFLQNLPESVTKDQLMALFSQYVACGLCRCPCSCPRRYPNLYEVRLIPTKKDIAFVEFVDEASATVAKDALHNYKLDGENKIKVCPSIACVPDCVADMFRRSHSPGSDVSPYSLLYCPCILVRKPAVYYYLLLLRDAIATCETVIGQAWR